MKLFKNPLLSSPFFLTAFTFSGLLTASISAQSPIDTAKNAKKQIPTNQEGIENTAETAKKALAPLNKQIDRNLLEMQKRALLVRERDANFHKNVMDGKVQPFAELRKRYTKEFPRLLEILTARKENIFNEQDPVKKKQLVQIFQKALKPIGAYLQTSHYAITDTSLTKQQHGELVRLQKLDPRTQIGERDLPELRAISDKLTHTLLNIPVYMDVKTQPNATVYFSTSGGGEFTNGLPMQQVTANDQGIATATWISKGDSVGLCNITVTSPQSSSPEGFAIRVIGLALKPLPKLPVIPEIPADIKKKLETLKESKTNKVSE